MAAKVILLDDEPGLCGRQEKLLSEAGYEVLKPQSLEDVRLLIDLGQVGLIVHGCHRTQTHKTLCHQISTQYPYLPTLHLETGNGISRDHRQRGLFHHVVGYLGSKAGFLKHVKTLSAFGRLKHQEQVHKSIVQEVVTVDRTLISLEHPQLVSKMLGLLETWTNCLNAFFLVPGDVDYYLNEMWKIKSLINADAYVRPLSERIHSLKDAEPEEITRFLLKANDLWKAGWRNAKTPLASDGLLMIPVRDPEDGTCEGYFLIHGAAQVKPGLKYWMDRFGLALKQSKKYMDAKSLCYIDDVTELYNQRYLGLALDAEVGRAKRNNSPFSVLFMDVDHFKKVNDDKGHLVGSGVLKNISRILKKNIRNFDYGFRYGGDEYLLLLVNTPSEGARVVGERIRREVEKTLFRVDGVELNVTMSIGIAAFPEHAKTKEEIIAIADKAMYHGKNKSRNIVFVAS